MATELFVNNASATVVAGGTTAPAAGTQEEWTFSNVVGLAASAGSTQMRLVDPADASANPEVMLLTNLSGGSAWRGIGPLSVGSLDSTQTMFTQAPMPPLARPVSGHLDLLFTASTQTAINLTTGEGLTLENSLKDAHTNGYKLALRLRGGERWPHWTASDATHPVNVWVTQDPAAPGTTRSTPAYATDVPMPWNAGASAADITGAVAASNWRYWHDWMMAQVADWLNGTCPLATDGHTRSEHVQYIPVTACSTYSTELQIASSINDANLRTYITGNSSTITGNTNVKAAWEACFKQCIDVCFQKFPAEIPIVFSGANMGWDGGATSTRSQFVIANYVIGQGYGKRVVAHRTDLRYSYFLTNASGGFGGGIDNDYSPYSWLQYCYNNGFGLAIQTAGDGDSSVLAGSNPATEADRVKAYVKTIEAVTNDNVIGTALKIAPIDAFLAIETTSSMTHPRAASGGTYTTGYHTTIPATGSFAGGDYCIAEYLFSAPTDMQDRLVAAAPPANTATITRGIEGNVVAHLENFTVRGIVSAGNIAAPVDEHTNDTDPHGDRQYAASIANVGSILTEAVMTVSSAAITATEAAGGTDVATLSITVTGDGSTPITLEFNGLVGIVGTGTSGIPAANQFAHIRVLEGGTEICRWTTSAVFVGTAYSMAYKTSESFVPVSGTHTYKINACVVGATSVQLLTTNSGVSAPDPQGNRNKWVLRARRG